MDNPQFKLFSSGSSPSLKLGFVYAVITGYKSKDSNQIKTECFYYSSRTKETKEWKSGFETVEDFWNSEPEKELAKTISNDEKLFSLKEFDGSAPDAVHLKELPTEKMLQIACNNKEFIEHLKQHTSCPQLKEWLNAGDMFKGVFEKNNAPSR